MINDVEHFIDFLIEHQITPRQYLLCHLLYTDAYKERPDGYRKYKDKPNPYYPVAKMYKLMEYWKKKYQEPVWTPDDIQTLVSKGFLEQAKKGDFSPDMLKVTNKFIDDIFATADKFEQFWEAYPAYIENFNDPQGQMIKLKAVDKDELEEKFKKVVRTHDEFLRLMDNLIWARDNNYVNMNIWKYLMSRQWVEDEKIREEKEVKPEDLFYGRQQ